MKFKGTTLYDLRLYAAGRAKKSARRNDPIAWSYWKVTEIWAGKNSTPQYEEGQLERLAEEKANFARMMASEFRYHDAAILYSQAKWLVILGRNRGLIMSPKKLGVNLQWLRDLERIA